MKFGVKQSFSHAIFSRRYHEINRYHHLIYYLSGLETRWFLCTWRVRLFTTITLNGSIRQCVTLVRNLAEPTKLGAAPACCVLLASWVHNGTVTLLSCTLRMPWERTCHRQGTTEDKWGWLRAFHLRSLSSLMDAAITDDVQSHTGWLMSVPKPKGHVTLVAITGIIILMHYLQVKSLQFLWRSDTFRFRLRVSDLRMSCPDSAAWQGTRLVAPTMAAGRHAPVKFVL